MLQYYSVDVLLVVDCIVVVIDKEVYPNDIHKPMQMCLWAYSLSMYTLHASHVFAP